MLTNYFQQMGFEIVQVPDGNSLYMHITLLSHLARVMVGSLGESRGYCDTKILDVASEEAFYWQHHEFSRAEELDTALLGFRARLRAHSFYLNTNPLHPHP